MRDAGIAIGSLLLIAEGMSGARGSALSYLVGDLHQHFDALYAAIEADEGELMNKVAPFINRASEAA